ncbi:isochorismatase family protein [Ferroplasma sp.]|uniref:isochorismatase family protein n=1 Tax=Ferroplasma sp. TaxID=2591003 RepID=UPI00307F0C9F
MIQPEDSVIILANYNADFFDNIFSKMEFLMGMDYINSFASKHKIPVIFTERKLYYQIKNPEVRELRNRKERNRIKNITPRSDYDQGFLKEFENKIKVKNVVSAEKEDIFYHSDLAQEINKLNRNTILLGGFFTDKDIFISSATANIMEFNTFVVSDITSTYSERLYFQSLEMISQFVDVLDTRDLEKYFPP